MNNEQYSLRDVLDLHGDAIKQPYKPFDWPAYMAAVRDRRKAMGIPSVEGFSKAIYRHTRIRISRDTLYKFEQNKQEPSFVQILAINLTLFEQFWPDKLMNACFDGYWKRLVDLHDVLRKFCEEENEEFYEEEDEDEEEIERELWEMHYTEIYPIDDHDRDLLHDTEAFSTEDISSYNVPDDLFSHRYDSYNAQQMFPIDWAIQNFIDGIEPHIHLINTWEEPFDAVRKRAIALKDDVEGNHLPKNFVIPLNPYSTKTFFENIDPALIAKINHDFPYLYHNPFYRKPEPPKPTPKEPGPLPESYRIPQTCAPILPPPPPPPSPWAPPQAPKKDERQ